MLDAVSEVAAQLDDTGYRQLAALSTAVTSAILANAMPTSKLDLEWSALVDEVLVNSHPVVWESGLTASLCLDAMHSRAAMHEDAPGKTIMQQSALIDVLLSAQLEHTGNETTFREEIAVWLKAGSRLVIEWVLDNDLPAAWVLTFAE
jgi:hypothetical protein